MFRCLGCGKPNFKKLCRECGSQLIFEQTEKALEAFSKDKRKEKKPLKCCSDCSNLIARNLKRCENCDKEFKKRQALIILHKKNPKIFDHVCKDCKSPLAKLNEVRCKRCWKLHKTKEIHKDFVGGFENLIEVGFKPIEEQIVVYFSKVYEKYIVISIETGELKKECEFIALRNCRFKVFSKDNNEKINRNTIIGTECKFSELMQNTYNISPRKIIYDPYVNDIFIDLNNGEGKSYYVSLQLDDKKKPIVSFFG